MCYCRRNEIIYEKRSESGRKSDVVRELVQRTNAFKRERSVVVIVFVFERWESENHLKYLSICNTFQKATNPCPHKSAGVAKPVTVNQRACVSHGNRHFQVSSHVVIGREITINNPKNLTQKSFASVLRLDPA